MVRVMMGRSSRRFFIRRIKISLIYPRKRGTARAVPRRGEKRKPGGRGKTGRKP